MQPLQHPIITFLSQWSSWQNAPGVCRWAQHWRSVPIQGISADSACPPQHAVVALQAAMAPDAHTQLTNDMALHAISEHSACAGPNQQRHN